MEKGLNGSLTVICLDDGYFYDAEAYDNLIFWCIAGGMHVL